jgi:hypothetical protein
MIYFTFTSNNEIAAFCNVIIHRMITTFGVTQDEAIDRINEYFSSKVKLSEQEECVDVLFSEGADYWAEVIYYTPLLLHEENLNYAPIIPIWKYNANPSRVRRGWNIVLFVVALCVLAYTILSLRAEPWGLWHPLATVEAVGGPGILNLVTIIWRDDDVVYFYQLSGIRAITAHHAEELSRLYAAGADDRASRFWLWCAMHPTIHDSIAVRIIASHGADLNDTSYGGMTPLTEACLYGENGSIGTVPILLEYGADPNIPDLRDGNTPLHLIDGKFPQFMMLLLIHGANPNARNKYGDTPLHYASSSTKLVTILLAHGVFIDARNNKGETPLWDAASGNQSSNVVSLLLDAGADPYIQANDGRTAFDVATPEALKVLRSFRTIHTSEYHSHHLKAQNNK